MKTIRIMNDGWVEPVYVEASEDRENLGRYGLYQAGAEQVLNAWKNAPREEGVTVREWSYSSDSETFTTALYDAGELTLDYWLSAMGGLWWTDRMPFDFEITEEDSAMTHELRQFIREALEGDSNDAEHDALVAVADEFHITYTPDLMLGDDEEDDHD